MCVEASVRRSVEGNWGWGLSRVFDFSGEEFGMGMEALFGGWRKERCA